MALCGIKKYDNLPAVVGWIDVDMLRWHLTTYTRPLSCWDWYFVGPSLRVAMRPAMSEERTRELLEKAYEQHTRKG